MMYRKCTLAIFTYACTCQLKSKCILDFIELYSRQLFQSKLLLSSTEDNHPVNNTTHDELK